MSISRKVFEKLLNSHKMFTKKLAKAFHIALIASCGFQTVPFIYNTKSQLLRVKVTVFNVVFRLHMLFGMLFLQFRLIQTIMREDMQADFTGAFSTFLSFVFIWNMVCFQVRSDFHRHEVAWLYNNTRIMNNRYNYPIPAKSRKQDAVSTWPQQHTIFIAMILWNFLQNPNQPPFLYSILPGFLQENLLVYVLCFISEAVLLINAANIAQTEFYTQMYIIASLIAWTEQATKMPITPRQMSRALTNYKIQTAVTTVFNNCYGQNIEQFKQVLAMASIIVIYFVVKYSASLPWMVFPPIVITVFFGLCGPPFFWGDACWIYDNSLSAKNKYIKALSFIRFGRKYFRAQIASMRPNKIVLNGLYFIDHGFTTTHLYFVLNSTVSVLLL